MTTVSSLLDTFHLKANLPWGHLSGLSASRRATSREVIPFKLASEPSFYYSPSPQLNESGEIVMGLMSRSASIMRYRAKGEMEGSFWDTVETGVRNGAFKPVESTGDETGVGWTSLEDFTDFEFRGSSYVRGNYVALSLRLDAVRVRPVCWKWNTRKKAGRLWISLEPRGFREGNAES